VRILREACVTPFSSDVEVKYWRPTVMMPSISSRNGAVTAPNSIAVVPRLSARNRDRTRAIREPVSKHMSCEGRTRKPRLAGCVGSEFSCVH
jgi:hypothetical protein